MAGPFGWLRHRDLPAVRGYLAAERAYYDQQMAPLAGLRDELATELTARVAAAEESVHWRRGGRWYFTRILPGQQYRQFCRTGPAGQPTEVLLDENVLLADPACTGGYVGLGVREVSPDGRLLAYSADFTGGELYQLRIRDLASGTDLPERIGRTSCGLAWSASSDQFCYVVTDPRYRPHEVWRHRLGTDPAADELVFREDDERFEVTVRVARSGAFVLIETASRDTSETLLVPAADASVPPAVLLPRRKGVEYRAEHADGPGGGEFFLVTNDGAAEFRLVAMPAGAPGRGRWTEVIAGDSATRLVRCDVFGDYLVVEQRRDAATQLRVVDRRSGEQRLVAADGPHMTLALAVNEEYRAAAVTVRTESLIDPPAWHDVDLASGRWQLRKRQHVPGHDPARYVTERVTAPASDGTAIPVTIAYRAGIRRDGTAPCLLYGYGAYESCEWPEFSVTIPSLLDRGFVYAVAHVRGGGEGGRQWWLDGRLTRKRTTFTDFIAAADMLAAGRWAAPDRIVSRGLSAGGLLQGAVFSMAPRRWRAVVAEVPFVDCVTSMLDPAIPLTVNEWDEWGDPRDPDVRRYMASYSPYDNVPAGPRPDLLVTGTLHDPRVLIHEPAKWVARLRATGTGDSRLLFRAELGAAAHAGPAGRYDRLAYEAEILAFVIGAAQPARPGRS
ncbi:MAG TPA: prolyl oligopeptidase family serine peptidase [Streptosporangiaceae bacterium]|nr:prolyl oligopeptidase family serine peptidase [Streptosporangiaceae bacterium]